MGVNTFGDHLGPNSRTRVASAQLPSAADLLYYSDQWQVVSEFVGSTADAIYSYHPHYIDAVALRMRDSGTHTVHTHFFLHDANFNVTAAVNATANTTGYRTVIERYAYTPYGEVAMLDADFSVDGDSDIDNELLYTGRRLDPETGLQLNRNRYYHQQLGRWVTRDPIGYDGSQWNLYECGAGSPNLSTDPLGLEPFPLPPGLFSPDLDGMTPPFKPKMWVCCRAVRPREGADCPERIGRGFSRHCELSYGPCPADTSQDDWTGYPVWYDDDNKRRTLPDGTSCSQASDAQIKKCLEDNPYSEGDGVPGSNCQTSTSRQLGKCCLNSSWKPNWYCHVDSCDRGECLNWIWIDELGGSIRVCLEWELPCWRRPDPR